MDKYVIYLNNAGRIKHNQNELIAKVMPIAGSDVSIYESYTFIDGTGYTKTVQDEIDFVFAGHEAKRLNIFTKKEFIKTWGFEYYLDFDINHLSGGWKKYLGIALFSNIIADTKIYFDSTRQLSDKLIQRFIHNLELTDINKVFFFEWDAMLLSDLNMKVLYESQEGFTTIQENKNSLNTNYE